MRLKFVLLLSAALVIACPAFADIVVNFSTPVTFTGFYSSEPLNLSYSDGVTSATVNSGYTFGAFTAVGDAGVTRIDFSGSPDFYVLDDIEYQIAGATFTMNFDSLAEGAIVTNQYAGWAGNPTFSGTGGNGAVILTYPDYNYFGYPYESFPNVIFETAVSTPTPEPGTLIMLGSGIIGLAGVLRRKINL